MKKRLLIIAIGRFHAEKINISFMLLEERF